MKGLPRIEELTEDDKTLYVIEKYISGTSMQEILEKQGTFFSRNYNPLSFGYL